MVLDLEDIPIYWFCHISSLAYNLRFKNIQMI
jgi:hypothetical protein